MGISLMHIYNVCISCTPFAERERRLILSLGTPHSLYTPELMHCTPLHLQHHTHTYHSLFVSLSHTIHLSLLLFSVHATFLSHRCCTFHSPLSGWETHTVCAPSGHLSLSQASFYTGASLVYLSACALPLIGTLSLCHTAAVSRDSHVSSLNLPPLTHSLCSLFTVPVTTHTTLTLFLPFATFAQDLHAHVWLMTLLHLSGCPHHSSLLQFACFSLLSNAFHVLRFL